jgi:peptidoglycan/LPS O-acetylase OafA/YrhL
MKIVSYLSNLTPLRGIAALLTVIFHTNILLSNRLLSRISEHSVTQLYLMVDFFFILSGFIMLHVYGKGFSDKITTAEFKRFTIARFARVYPLHFATLMYCIAMYAIASALGIPKMPVLEINNNGFSIFTNLFLLQSMNFHDWYSWGHGSWSISTEWWMYMLFPFLVRPFMKLGDVGKAVVATGCFVGYALIMLYIIPIVTNPAPIPYVRVDPASMSLNAGYQYGFLRCFFGFVLGMMMYHGYQKEWGKAWLGNGYTMLLLVLGLILCLHFPTPDVFTVIFFPFILLSAAYGSEAINAFLGLKPLQKLGDWSFSIYLLHQPLLFTFIKILDYQRMGKPIPQAFDVLTTWMLYVPILGFILLISSLTYRFFELPARNGINQLAKKEA